MSLKSAEKTGTNEYTVSLSIAAETFKAAVDKVYNKQKTKIAIPGFRKGKAPRSFIEKYYGSNVFYEDALDEVFPDEYEAAVKEAGIDVVSSPFDFDIASIGVDGVELSCKVTVKPVIELGEYKGLKAEKKPIEVTDDEVEHEISHAREDNARIIDIDSRAAQDGDITTIDFEGFVDGVAFDGGKGEKYDLTLGSGQFIPGFEEQIVGHSIGDSFDVTVTFPAEYGAEDLAGKEAVFKVVLHAVKIKELPELDDEFAKDVSEFDTFAEYKDSVKKEISERKEHSAKHDFENAVLSVLAENVTAEIPECMIEKVIDNNMQEMDYRLSSQGMSLQQYIGYMGMDMDTFRASYKDSAEKSVKIDLAFEKIAELEKIEVSDEELDAEYAKFAEQYKMEIEDVKKAIDSEALKAELVNRKVSDFVIDASVAEAPAAEEAPAEKKPAKKTAKKTAETADDSAAEEKPKKKAPAKKTAKKEDSADAE